MAESLTLRTLARCQLLIGRYPAFRYDARGGGGPGHSSTTADGRSSLQFPADQLSIPPLDWRSTRFLGLPLPAGLSIAIQPEALSGRVDPRSGEVWLQFRSRFRFQLGAGENLRYQASDLVVDTQLTTEAISSQRHQRQGRRLDEHNRAMLVGTALIEPCGEAWLDRFLGLPDEALAVLECRLALP